MARMIIVAPAKFVARCCGVATQNAKVESLSRKSVQRFCGYETRKMRSKAWQANLRDRNTPQNGWVLSETWLA